MDNRYQNGKIYIIYSIDSPDSLPYYGSTIQTLNQRKKNHESEYFGYLRGVSTYISSYEVIKRGNYDIKLVVDYPCGSKKELERREGEFIRKNTCVNIRIEGRTSKEYREDNKQVIKEKAKRYYEANKKKILEQQRGYYKQQKEKYAKAHENKTQ
jgi:hypothetical protein